jgi:hypothetical protein
MKKAADALSSPDDFIECPALAISAKFGARGNNKQAIKNGISTIH